mgnify:CR=1 FL=1
MNILTQKILIPNKNVELYIRREDLIHPYISGNKFRKLKYNIEEAQKLQKKTLLSFGGAVAKASAAFAGVVEPGFVGLALWLLLHWPAATAFFTPKQQPYRDAMMASVKYTAPAVRYPFARSAVLGWLCVWLAVVSGGGVAWYAASVWTAGVV